MPTWSVEPERAGERVDVFLAREMEVSRGEAQRLLERRAATVNGFPARANQKLRSLDSVRADRPEPQETHVSPESIPLAVVFEDRDVLVIDKPRGMVVHPAPGSECGTVVNAVLAHSGDLSGIGGELRPGIVHRLDKDTSGLLVIAKSDSAHISLQAQIQARTAERRYRAILWGVPRFREAEIDAPIGRHPRDRKKMAVVTDPRFTSRDSVTELTVREPLGHFSFAEARLRTGRTHQIRVHCAYIGHPVVGDPLYGGLRKVPQDVPLAARRRIEGAMEALGGQALHAYCLAFDHPRTGERLQFTAAMPAEMKDMLDAAREAM